MAIDQNWLNFLRVQYPVGTRIKLREMNDPYSPVEPGTMGTLNHIDDVGSFHIVWDNGRTLGLIPGEDDFTVMPAETHLLKLYMPMTVDVYERNEYGDMEHEPTELSASEAVSYADNIAAALLRERRPNETERGMMTYFDGDDGVDRKVESYNFTAEVKDGRLWGVAECRVRGELTPNELASLKDNVSGQASDGFGEGFEQREIKVDGRELYAHLWQWDNWSLRTEQETFSPKFAEGLPAACFSTLPSDGSLILIDRGEQGYSNSNLDLHDPEQNRSMADFQNKEMGVTSAQEQAMVFGSMFDWDKPGADPKVYEKMGGMNQCQTM